MGGVIKEELYKHVTLFLWIIGPFIVVSTSKIFLNYGATGFYQVYFWKTPPLLHFNRWSPIKTSDQADWTGTDYVFGKQRLVQPCQWLTSLDGQVTLTSCGEP